MTFKTKSEQVQRMLADGVADSQIRRQLHITKTSLAAYKAHATRQNPGSKNGRQDCLKPDKVRRIVVGLLDTGASYEDVRDDPRLRNVPDSSLSAYFAHYERGSYNNRDLP
jgi:hypothetical protein